MKFIKFLTNLIKYAINKEIGRHAQSLSFSTVLALVPITTIFLGVLASSHWVNISNQNIENMLQKNLFPKAISQTFVQYISIFSNQASGIKSIGLTFFIISICFLFRDMESSFSVIVDSKSSKKWYFSIFVMFLLFIAPLFIFFILGFSEWLTSMSMTSIKNIIYTLTNYSITLKIILFMILWFWFLFLYRVLPHKRISYKSLILGSLISATAFTLSQKLFGIYIDTFSTYQIIYGVFAAIPIFLLWIYLNWQITLYGLLISYFIEITYNIKPEEEIIIVPEQQSIVIKVKEEILSNPNIENPKGPTTNLQKIIPDKKDDIKKGKI